MGLLLDNNGIPLSYDLFPGNESEKLMMRPTLRKSKAKFGIDRTIIVADRGQNTSDNTVFIAEKMMMIILIMMDMFMVKVLLELTRNLKHGL